MATTEGKDTPSPLQKALEKSQVKAQVVACDHHRIHGGLAVESDFIVLVYPKEPELFDSFALSKTYSAFRSLAHQLEQVVNDHHKEKDVPGACEKALQYCRLVPQLIESQRAQYLGKVNFMYVKLLAKERQRIIDSVLDATVKNFPSFEEIAKYELVAKVATIVRTFFLTDHCVVDAEALLKEGAMIPEELRRHRQNLSIRSASNKVIQQVPETIMAPLAWLGDGVKKVASNFPKREEDAQPQSTAGGGSVIVPMSYKRRRSQLQRDSDEVELATIAGEQARLLLDDDRHSAELVPSYAHPGPVVRADTTKFGKMIDNNPMIFAAIALAAIHILMKAARVQVHLDGDISLLIVFAAFCVGLHTPRPLVGGFDRPPSMIAVVKQNNETIQQDKSGRALLSRAMTQQQLTADLTETAMNETETNLKTTPMTKLPEGSPPVGPYVNSWSDPDPSDFEVRGPKYLTDKKKIGSAEYLFPSRGLELLLTDTCPGHVALNPRIFGGKLRDVPTFLINFRLPWGLLIFYFEIPERFLPFVRAGFESTSGEERKSLDDTLASMSAPDRAVGRFMMNDEKYKNESLKILPVVIDGPWVVRQVVGGKPAIIGNRLPVKYHYGAASAGSSLYLEADLDIAASSAARGILSVARSYTQILTLNLGFVVQGNKEDELPEQMLVGMRLHGIDPLTAPAFPTLLPHNDNDALLEQVDSDGGESCT